MKIAIVCFPTYGGSGAVATELGIELAKRGHEIHFIANDVLFRLDEDWHKNITFHLVEDVDHPVLEDSSVYVLTLANKIAEVCRRYDIEIVHSHFAVPHAAAAMIARDVPGTQAKFITTFHGSDVNQFGPDLNLRDVISHALDVQDGLTAVADKLGEAAVASYNLKQPVETIYNWVPKRDYPASQAAELRDLFGRGNHKLIAHISNFREVKRIQDVISIFNGIHKKVDAKLLMIGDGPEQRIAHRLIVRYKLMNHVHMLGLQTNISRILSISDLFLLPSSSEAFSLAALEAMSFGVPVITTNVGGMPEMIQDGVNGHLAEVGDTGTMITQGIRLLTDTDYANRMRQQAKATVKEKFTADIIVAQYEKLYEKVLTQA